MKDPENKLAETDRAMCKLAELIMNLRQGKETPDFGRLSLPTGETFPDVKFKKGALLASRLGTSNISNQSTPIFIVCVLGGISVNEIRELRSLEDHPDCQGYITIMGGSIQHTPIDFVKEIQRAVGLIKEDMEALNQAMEKEKWLKEQFEKDKKEAEDFIKNPTANGAVDPNKTTDEVELKDAGKLEAKAGDEKA